MSLKSLPFTQQQIESICATYLTPFHLYDEDGIRSVCRRLHAALNMD